MKKQEESPALHLVRHVWSTRPEFGDTSWRRINGSMHDALCLAIDAGLRFDASDFKTIYDDMRGTYWFGAEHCRYHSRSVLMANASAWQSYEAWLGWKPFIWKCSSREKSWSGDRLHVGARFHWEGEFVTCTSMDSESLIACSYKAPVNPRKECSECGGYVGGSDRETIKRRFTITQDDLRSARKAIRDTKKAEVEAAKNQVAPSDLVLPVS